MNAMTPIDSFSHLLNGIFSEFQADSTIVISYILLTNDNAGPEKHIPRLTGVNGFSNSDAYRDYLQSAKARLLSSIEDCLAGLDDRSRQQFLRLVMERCQRYALLTVPWHGNDRAKDHHWHPRTHWVFHHATFDAINGHKPDAGTRRYLIWRTRRFAFMWRQAGRELMEELHGMYYLIEFYPVVARNVNGKPPTEKIILKGSVPELAAVLRLLHDAGIIENKNKEEVCRLAAACFSTHFTNDLSAGSLKNHFDAPTPEIIDRVYKKFEALKQNAPKLKYLK